jgi:hypothetical protein
LSSVITALPAAVWQVGTAECGGLFRAIKHKAIDFVRHSVSAAFAMQWF